MTTVVKIGTEFQVNSQTAGSQWYPSVTGLTNGGFVVTWQDGLAGSTSGSSSLGDASGSAVHAQVYAADGSKVGGEFLVNTQTTGSQATPVVTGLSNGGFVISWQDQNSTSGDIKAQIYGANGAPVGGEFVINSVTANNQNTPAITGLPNGGFVVAWTNQGSSAADVKAQVYDASGAKVGSEFLVNSSNPSFDQERASIATLGNGDFVVTWNDFRTGNWEVRGQVFHPGASGATKVGAEFTVDQAYYNARMVAGVTGLANGNFVISFEDTAGEIRAQVFTAGGVKVGSEFQANTQTSGNQGFSSITALKGGGFVVTWSDEGVGDGNGPAIKAQVYDAAGSKIGGEYVVNTQIGSNQLYPNVAALANGGFVISWTDFSQTLGDNSGYGITAQIFNLSNAPTTPTIVSVTDDVSPNTGALANGASTNDTNLTVRISTGSNFAGDVVQLFDGQTAIGTAVTLSLADIARGYVDIQTGVLGNAAHAITAKVTDTTGAVSDAATAINVIVDTVAPAVAVTGVVLDNGNLPTVTVNGVSEAGQLVSIYDGATLVGTATAGIDGSWSLSGVTLTEGANNLSAKATDAAGNSGTSTTFAAPTLVSTGTTSVNASTTTAMGYVVLGAGILDVVSGGNVSGQITIGNGGIVGVETGATAQHATILAGGIEYAYGTANDTTVQAGGAQHVYFGGNATNTTVAAGGYQDVFSNSTVSNVSLSGNQQVLAGGTAIDTTVESGGYQYVGAGGASDGTLVKTGGFQYIDAGGSASDTVIDGGFQYVDGTATGGSVGGGSSQGGGVATGVTVKNGGAQHVYHGGSAAGTIVTAGGFQDVYHATVSGTHLSGNQQVLDGGVAANTVIENGGNSYVGAGGSVTATTVNGGGLLYVDAGGSAASTTINGGVGFVIGTTSGTTLNSGELDVAGTADNTHLAGGVEHVYAGGVQHDVDFAGSAATLSLEAASGLTGTVSNFELGDTIDLLNVSVSSFIFDGSTLTLATNSGTYAYQFAGVQSGTELNVTDDGHGGSTISLSLLVQQSASIVPDAGIESSPVSSDTTQQQTTLASHG
ncbi:AIDA repeat-containing protein [Bradyrhizobium sp.]|jgi:autotransporter passenger strand-loop-strand repeat protein|uniref:AIDA repeat-containing protein n=1 Tax=Bradyrhizobium sp. TaxID=376 RepID=UPI002DDCF638|nr:AIDA repeat-containing protein [Bradyrhizobium sp.]HEV2156714.1 AIDA repeat-containing protein [Bradyrhizobium sp.]